MQCVSTTLSPDGAQSAAMACSCGALAFASAISCDRDSAKKPRGRAVAEREILERLTASGGEA
jgi:hypothetical protein